MKDQVVFSKEELEKLGGGPIGPISMSHLALDTDQKSRALHRVLRAMHDGECPKCHNIHASDRMWRGRGYNSDPTRDLVCPSCLFAITGEEANAILKQFGPFMEESYKVFEEWRRDRSQETPGVTVITLNAEKVARLLEGKVVTLHGVVSCGRVEIVVSKEARL